MLTGVLWNTYCDLIDVRRFGHADKIIGNVYFMFVTEVANDFILPTIPLPRARSYHIAEATGLEPS